MSKHEEDLVEVWLEDARIAALPGTRAEKAVELVSLLYNTIKSVANCDGCMNCCLTTEAAITECEEIVEKI